MTPDNLGSDGMPYTTLTYANGPSYISYFRENLTKVDVGMNVKYMYNTKDIRKRMC